MNSSQNQEQNPNKVIPIQASVDGLVKSWKRRQKWQLVFHNQEPENLSSNKKQRAPWRIRLAKFLESTPVHVISILLILTDLVFTLLDLSFSVLSCKNKKEDEENELFHWGGIVILIILSLKVLASIVATGTSFFVRPGHVIDGVFVTSALILEFLKKEWSGLLLLVSLWRIVRVVESVFELSNQAMEAKIVAIQRQFEALQNRNQLLPAVTA
ncbi:hypothetical protein MKW98_028559 [Papaver atlanticum]|uniref:Voltage-gated hydrogen channel 1 n=1 Tax=Papaver atlanticum TaxID=357466 RepID=A0AAD4TEL6_9MAGN|nr:hypothetical protein MKW98_028559 [Papaver atlanticum]